MKHVQNHRTQRLLLCVVLSLVVHVGLAASFVSAIQLKSVQLEIVNPIQVSLVQDVSDAIGTAASQSTEPNLNQPADKFFDTDNEVSNESDLAVVANIDTYQSTEFAEIEQPSTPLPVIEEEVNSKHSEPEVQPTSTKVSNVSSTTEQSSEPNELESTESEIVKAVAEPIPSEPVSERLTRIAEPVKKPTNQMTYRSVEDEIESRIESVNEPVSDIQHADDSNSLVPTSSEIIADVPDADELAGIWSSETIESVSVNYEPLPLNESTTEEIAEPAVQVKAAGFAELPEPISILKSEIAQITPPNVIDIELLEGENSSTTSVERKTNFDEQFTHYAPSNPIQIAYSRIDDGLDHSIDFEFQPVSEITPTENSILQEQMSGEQFVDISDADELAGIWPTEAIEPATLAFNQPPSNKPTSEISANSEIEVASISELPDSVALPSTETSQGPPPEIIELTHFTENVPAISISQTAYFGFDDGIEHSTEADQQLKPNITPVETSNVPIPASSELVAEISDADELAGIWSTEAIEPATIEFEPSSSNEPIFEEIEEFQGLFADSADLSEPVQLSAYETEPKSQLVPTAPVPVINQTTFTTDLDEETPNTETVGLNDSLFSNQAPSGTDQLAYAPTKLEPKPIQEEILAAYKTPLEDESLREADPLKFTTTEQVIEPEVDKSETKRKEKVSDTTVENQPEFDNSSPLTNQESPDRTDLAETDENSIPKEMHQVASLDPIQPAVNSSDQGTTNTVTQKSGLDSISSDVEPKYGIKGLSNQAPRYPYLSRVNDEQGRVILRVIVDHKGRAKEVKVLESSGYSRLDKAARKAVKRWRFQPAQKNGQSTQGVVQVPINFVLDSS